MKTFRMKARMGWYGAKTVFRHYHGTARGCFEERIILLKARGFKEAIKVAEAEARQYAKDVGGCKYLEFVDVFKIFEKTGTGHGTEIYSQMRESRLKPKQYLDTFYDTGKERTQSV